MKKQFLMAGGIGYIDSHTGMALEAAGYDMLVFDDLSTGHAEFLRFSRHESGVLADRAVTLIAVEKLFRRPGDPARLVGDAQKAFTELGWKPRYADLETIVRTAWDWERASRCPGTGESSCA